MDYLDTPKCINIQLKISDDLANIIKVSIYIINLVISKFGR